MHTRTGFRFMAAAACFTLLASMTPLQAQTADVPTAEECKKNELASVLLIPIQALCEPIDPYFKANKAAIDKMITRYSRCLPANDTTVRDVRKKVAEQKPTNLSDAQKQARTQECTDYKLGIIARLRPTNPLYSSPGSTWKEYRAALIAHDRQRARNCLASGAGNGEGVLSLPDTELTKSGQSLAEQLTIGPEAGEDLVEAYIASKQADGTNAVGSVEFVKVNGNWLIDGI